MTHALNVLDKTDYIYVMENGKVAEEGTYSVSTSILKRSVNDYTTFSIKHLMKDGILLPHLIDEHGGINQPSVDQHHKQKDAKNVTIIDTKGGINKSALMTDEERERGAISWSIYRDYLKYAGGVYWAPIVLLLLTLSQAAQGTVLSFHHFLAGSNFDSR